MFRHRSRRRSTFVLLVTSASALAASAGEVATLQSVRLADNDRITSAPDATVALVQCPSGGRRRMSYEPVRSYFRRLSWRWNSNHAHLMHQSVEPYWLPDGGYHETTWRRPLVVETQSVCPCPKLLHTIEEEPLSAPELAPALPPNVPLRAPEPAPPASPQNGSSGPEYSPEVAPRATEAIRITPMRQRF